MKLKELAIDGLGVNRTLQLGRITDGFSLIYGENGAGKTALCNLVRETLIGFNSARGQSNRATSPGWLTVTKGMDEFRIKRDLPIDSANSVVDVQPLNANQLNHAYSLHQLIGNGVSNYGSDLNSELYNSVFNVSFRNTAANADRLGAVLVNQLGVPTGPSAVGDDSAYLVWQRESQARREQLETLRVRIDELRRERIGYQTQIESAEATQQARLSDLDRQINQVVARINEMKSGTIQGQISNLDREIAGLRLLIENAKPIQTPIVSTMQPLPVDLSLIHI